MNPTETLSGWSKFWYPEDLSKHGHGIDLLQDVLHWFMLLLFVAWGIFLMYSLVRFRAKNNPAALYEPIKAKLSKGAEIAVVLFEIVLLVVFSMPVWAMTKDKENSMPKPEDNPLEVRIIAQQFQWNVHYPGKDGRFGRIKLDLIDPVENPIGIDRDDADAKDDVVTLGYLRAPVNRPVLTRLTTLDVIHSFWIPQMRSKQDTIPGMEIPLWFTPTETSDALRERTALRVSVPEKGLASSRFLQRYKNRIPMEDYGAFKKGTLLSAAGLEAVQDKGLTEILLGRLEPMEIQCAQLCGLNHFSMRGFFKVMEEDKYEAWYAAAIAEALEEGGDEWGDDDDDDE